jgi:glycopeptide antibiotics resistance protein
MITNFLLDHAALVPVSILLLALICAVIGWFARDRRRLLWTLTGIALVPVFALTLVPSSRSGVDGVTCTLQFSAPTLGSVELLANVALFLPPVFFAALATRRPLVVLAAGIGLSVVIEAVQALIPAIGRACDTNDWLMNTIGAVVGVALAYLISRRPRPSRTSG